MPDLNREFREHVGVLDTRLFLTSPDLRRYILLFDRLAVPDFHVGWSGLRSILRSILGTRYITEIEFLVSQGILFEPSLTDLQGLETRAEFQNLLTSYRETVCKSCEAASQWATLASSDPAALRALVEHGLKAADYNSRAVSILLRERDGVDSSPLVSCFENAPDPDSCRLTQTVRIVFNALPVLSESASLDQVLQFRGDPDTKYKLHRLRRWMHNIAGTDIPTKDIEDELQWLLHDYRKHMEVHRMKSEVGTLEVMVVTVAEIAENLVKFKWGRIAKTLFSVKQQEVALMEAELKAPGGDVAYIAKAKDTF